MAVYTLINQVAVPFFLPVTIIPPITDGPIPQNVISPSQGFQLTVKGNSGVAVSASAQVVVSNDGKIWANYFPDAISVSGTTEASAAFGGSGNWKYFSAYLSDISGLGAKATLTMNA